MPRLRPLLFVAIAAGLTTGPAVAQSAATDYRDEFMHHFRQSTEKIMSLAEEMPEELYMWSPGPGVLPVGQVYMHIARYNYFYPATALGIPAPADVDVANLESIADKATITRLLRQSIDHVRLHVSRMTPEDLTRTTTLYRRQIAGWAVLFQLLAHMNEHVGQSVSYARMNGIVPPWSM